MLLSHLLRTNFYFVLTVCYQILQVFDSFLGCRLHWKFANWIQIRYYFDLELISLWRQMVTIRTLFDNECNYRQCSAQFIIISVLMVKPSCGKNTYSIKCPVFKSRFFLMVVIYSILKILWSLFFLKVVKSLSLIIFQITLELFQFIIFSWILIKFM